MLEDLVLHKKKNGGSPDVYITMLEKEEGKLYHTSQHSEASQPFHLHLHMNLRTMHDPPSTTLNTHPPFTEPNNPQIPKQEPSPPTYQHTASPTPPQGARPQPRNTTNATQPQAQAQEDEMSVLQSGSARVWSRWWSGDVWFLEVLWTRVIAVVG